MKAMLRLLFTLFLSSILISKATAQCNADFTFTVNGSSVSFAAVSTQSQVVHTWIFGDGTSLTGGLHNPVHPYIQPGTYTVIHATRDTVSNCIDSVMKTVTLNFTPACDAVFTYSINGLTVNFTPVATTSNFSHQWIFSDGTASPATSPSHTFSQAGQYSVTHILSDAGSNCWDSTTQTITLGSQPASCQSHFTYSVNSNDSLSYSFSSQATASSGILQYVWLINGVQVGTSTTLNYTFPQPGSYSICHKIITQDSCQATSCDSITIYGGSNPACNAAFVFQLVDPNLMQYMFSSSSTGGNTSIQSYKWVINGGQVSTDSSFVHNFLFGGTYNVCLEIRTANGCVSQVCRTVVVQSPCALSANFTYGFLNNEIPRQVQFHATPVNPAYVYKWTVPGNAPFYGPNPAYTFYAPGNYPVYLLVRDSLNNCFDSVVQNINIAGSPADSCVVDFTYTESSSQPGQFSFNVTSNQPVVSQYWVFFSNTDSTSTQVMNPTHTFTDTGSYYACVTVVTNTGCTRSLCKIVQVTSTGRMGNTESLPSYPNPVPGNGSVKVNVELEESMKIMVNVYNTSGNLVKTVQQQGVRGGNVISIPVDNLQRGQYFIDIHFGDKRKRSVFQKL